MEQLKTFMKEDEPVDPDAVELERVSRGLEASWMGKASEPFSDRVLELAYEPVGMGSMDDADAIGGHCDACGDRLEVFLKIEDGRIAAASFLSDGCGASLACGSAVVQLARNKTIPEARKISADSVASFLGGLPESARHSAEDWAKALHDGVKKACHSRKA